MAETALAKKLLIRPGQRVLVLNAPEGYLGELEPLPEAVDVATEPTGTGAFDVVQLFARDTAQLDRDWSTASAATKPGGVLWVAWLKQSAKLPTDLNRDSLWARLRETGWTGVASISVNEMWSALRFRPEGEVGNKSTGKSTR